MANGQGKIFYKQTEVEIICKFRLFHGLAYQGWFKGPLVKKRVIVRSSSPL